MFLLRLKMAMSLRNPDMILVEPFHVAAAMSGMTRRNLRVGNCYANWNDDE